MTEQAEIIENQEDAAQVEEAGDAPETENNDVVVSFGDDQDDKPQDSSTIKKMRETISTQNRQIKDLKKTQAKTDEMPALGAKPTLEGSDYDEDKFSDDLNKWHDEKREHENVEQAKNDALEQQDKAWKGRVDEYRSGFTAFESDDVDEAEATVKGVLSDMQHNTLIETFGKGAAPLIVGLAADDDRLEELSKIKSIARFIAAATRLEMSMKVTPRKPSTSPESSVSGSGGSNMGDTTLDKLEAEADKTGNRSAIIAHKRKMRLAG